MADTALYRKVADTLRKKGALHTDEVESLLPGIGKKRVSRALSNAKAQGWIRIERAKTGGRTTLWAPVFPGVVPSVWDLAEPRELVQTMTGRQYSPLGDWPDYQPREAA